MIGIFGDSYAYEHHKETNVGWPTHLSKLYNEDYENHSLYASSLAYSYEKFLNADIEKYSKIIFVCTETRRQMLMDSTKLNKLHFDGQTASFSENLNNDPKFWENTNYELSKDRKLNRTILKSIEQVSTWYPNTWDFVETAITRDVMKSHPKALVLTIRNLINVTYLDIDTETMQPWLPNQTHRESLELGRECHLSKKQNIEIAGYIKDYFDNGFDIQQTFALENVHKFYTKAKTLKEAGFLKL